MNELRRYRTDAQLTVMQLAELLGVKPVTVYAWECGRNVIQPDQAKAIVLLLRERGVQITLDDLYGMPGTSAEAA